MASLYEGGPTHTSDTFRDFTYDLLDYALPECKHVWASKVPGDRTSKKIFKDWFGDVVVLFRNKHLKDYKNKLDLINLAESTEDAQIYVGDWIRSIFKGEIPLMEFITYCALLLDIVQICIELEDLDLLFNVQEDTLVVFRLYIQPYFTIIGGWHALYRCAEQYLTYMNSNPPSNSDASVARKDVDPLEFTDTYKL